MRRRQATSRAWDQGSLSVRGRRHRRGFTGERYQVLDVTDDDASVATFAVSGEVGRWHLHLGLGVSPGRGGDQPPPADVVAPE